MAPSTRRRRPQRSFPFLSLSTELQHLIAAFLPVAALNALVQTSRYCHSLLTASLYSRSGRSLYEAATYGWVELARYQIERLGAKVDEPDEHSTKLPIELAVTAPRADEMVRLLIRNGCKVSLRAVRYANWKVWTVMSEEELKRAERVKKKSAVNNGVGDITGSDACHG